MCIVHGFKYKHLCLSGSRWLIPSCTQHCVDESFWFGMPRLAAVDTAKNAPHKDPAWVEEGDDGMEEVVWAIVLLVHDGCLLCLGRVINMQLAIALMSV